VYNLYLHMINTESCCVGQVPVSARDFFEARTTFACPTRVVQSDSLEVVVISGY